MRARVPVGFVVLCSKGCGTANTLNFSVRMRHVGHGVNDEGRGAQEEAPATADARAVLFSDESDAAADAPADRRAVVLADAASVV